MSSAAWLAGLTRKKAGGENYYRRPGYAPTGHQHHRCLAARPQERAGSRLLPRGCGQTHGVRPDQIVDYKALVGDVSDNIPGVRGVGEKTAIELLGKYDTLDNIFDHLDEIKGRANKPLSQGREAAYLSQDLARIRTDLPVILDLEQAEPVKFDPLYVEHLFEELEFRTLTQRLKKMNARLQPSLQGQNGIQSSLFPEEEKAKTVEELPQDASFETVIVNDAQTLETCVDELKNAKRIAFDTETSGLDPMLSDLVGISLAAGPARAITSRRTQKRDTT